MKRLDPLYKIRGTSSEPLSFEDEMSYLRRWKRRKCYWCRDRLIKNYLLFAAKTTKRFYHHITNAEMVSIANMAVIEAIEKFDVDRTASSRLSTIIPFYVRINHTRMICERQTVKLPVKKALDRTAEEPVFTGLGVGDAGARLMGVEDSLLDKEAASENVAKVEKLLKQLPQPHRKIIQLVYFQNLSFAEVARRSNPPVTREAVRQRHVKAMRLFKEILAQNNITSL